MAYLLNDWTLSDPANVLLPTRGNESESESAEEISYVTFSVADLSVAPYTNITQVASSTDNGNSVEIVADLSEEDSGSYLAMYIDDGTNRQGIKIYKGRVTLLDGSSETIVENEAGAFHRYTITMKQGHFQFLFDKEIAIDTFQVQATEGSQLFIGFSEGQSGSFVAKFQYIKYAHAVYNYVVLENVDFELQIDSAPTFDSVNLHTYTKDSFLSAPATDEDGNPIYYSWDPVSYTCGTYKETINNRAIYDGKGLITACTVKLPQKADMQDPVFFYRVRFTGPYESDYSYTYFDNREDVTTLSSGNMLGYEYQGVDIPLPQYIVIYDFSTSASGGEGSPYIQYGEDDAGFHQITSSLEDAYIILPPTPVADNWKISFLNVGSIPITVNTSNGDNLLTLGAHQVVSYQYDTADNKWYSFVEQQPASFRLRPDITSEIFKAVYGAHLPADMDDVYTKEYNTGVAATIIRSESKEVSKLFNEMQDDSDRIGSFTAPNDLFTQRWGSVYNMDKSLFKNAAEMRDAFQVFTLNLQGQMMKDSMIDVIRAMTGAAPDLIAYKDKAFNIIWDSATSKKISNDKKFYLYDPEHPSFTMNPFVVYGGDAQAYTFQLNIYDPFDLQYNTDMVKQVVELFKPGWTKAILVFHNAEGYPIQKKYYYGIDNYYQASYNQ